MIRDSSRPQPVWELATKLETPLVHAIFAAEDVSAHGYSFRATSFLYLLAVADWLS
jgi:hypothetical protein